MFFGAGGAKLGGSMVRWWSVIKAGLRWPYMTWWAAEKGFKSQGCVPALYQPDLWDWILASASPGLMWLYCGLSGPVVVLVLCSNTFISRV